ncbi:nucleotidyl transferase AbiEii/AbiGii toxin family protein [Candidatus Woesearchaeota archaeon]|nr:nucleotidyl transferase AbiEii/AbiGii toxin family protein [Candidatus Woesearchaeota archaeon]
MISREELERIAKIKVLSTQNAEKDYLLELLLFAIYKKTRAFAFKGGTALYKIYGLNRFSEDLDFTLIKRGFKAKETFNLVLRELSYLGLEGTMREFVAYQREINIRLLFKGPLYQGTKESLCYVSVNISLRERPLLEPVPEMLPSLYKEIPAFEVYSLQPEELLAEKVRAVLTREKSRDVYDVWFLLKRGFSLNQNLINRKLKHYKLRFDKTTFLKKVLAAQKNWQTDLGSLIIGRLPDFGTVRADITTTVGRLGKT